MVFNNSNKKEETTETEGLDLIPKVDVKEIIAKKEMEI